jgi:mRNA interferase HigB
MVIMTYKKIEDFIKKHPDSKEALNNWYKISCASDWGNFHEIKQIFNSVDAVGNDRYIFNIRGNNYRIVASILFNVRTVFIKFIGTHQQYDRIDASEV